MKKHVRYFLLYGLLFFPTVHAMKKMLDTNKNPNITEKKIKDDIVVAMNTLGKTIKPVHVFPKLPISPNKVTVLNRITPNYKEMRFPSKFQNAYLLAKILVLTYAVERTVDYNFNIIQKILTEEINAVDSDTIATHVNYAIKKRILSNKNTLTGTTYNNIVNFFYDKNGYKETIVKKLDDIKKENQDIFKRKYEQCKQDTLNFYKKSYGVALISAAVAMQKYKVPLTNKAAGAFAQALMWPTMSITGYNYFLLKKDLKNVIQQCEKPILDIIELKIHMDITLLQQNLHHQSLINNYPLQKIIDQITEKVNELINTIRTIELQDSSTKNINEASITAALSIIRETILRELFMVYIKKAYDLSDFTLTKIPDVNRSITKKIIDTIIESSKKDSLSYYATFKKIYPQTSSILFKSPFMINNFNTLNYKLTQINKIKKELKPEDLMPPKRRKKYDYKK